MSELAKAVIQVMKDVKGLEKDMTVGSGNYSYKGVSDYEAKKIYNKSMAENGLCILPISIDSKVDIYNYTEVYNGNAKQKKSVFTEVKTKYLLLHESGESKEIAGYGHGIDNQDKGAGKATTYALKYALLYTFLTPTGKIDDSDNTHSEDVKQTNTPSQVNKPSKLVLTAELAQKHAKDKATLVEIKQTYNVTAEQEVKYISLLKN